MQLFRNRLLKLEPVSDVPSKVTPMATVCLVRCDSCNGSRSAYTGKSLCTSRVVTHAALSGGRRFCSNRKPAAVNSARCVAHGTISVDCNERGKREHQQLLWRTFFQDHIRWWDNRRQKKILRAPYFRYKESRGALRLENRCKPDRVDEQLTPSDARDYSAPAAVPLPDHPDVLVGVRFVHRLKSESVKKLCKQGQLKGAIEALEVLAGMNSGIDKYLLYIVLKECMVKKDLMLGGQVHTLVIKQGFGSDKFLCNHLIRLYVSHGMLQEAMDVFKGVALPDSFMWSSIISGYSKHGQAEGAIKLYQHMLSTGTKPDNHVFVAALHACAIAGDLQSGKQVHSQIKERKLESDVVVARSLVNMYAKCGSLTDARTVFDGLRTKDVVTWTVMIAGYAKVEGMGQDALTIYSAMHSEGMAIPDAVAFVCLLQACANVGVSALEKGRQLHSQIKERGLESETVVGGSLVNMYAKCGSLTDARTVFEELREKNVVTWSAMIAGYAKVDGMAQYALSLHSAMTNQGMAVPNVVTFVCLLQACANVGGAALEKGKQLHSQLIDRGLDSEMVVGGSLVNMYAKCGSLRDARAVFDGLQEKNVVAWNVMIAGYAQKEGMGQEALNIYRAMRKGGMAIPNSVTYMSLLEACGNVGALQQGTELHAEILGAGFESNALIGTFLVKMYGQCGRLEVSREVFDKLPIKSVETWTALLSGYAEHAEGHMAIQCFEELLEQGVQPNEVTYICLLTACSHAGLVDEGLQYFETMEERHGVKPDEWHYACMVDLLGRAGYLDRAVQMLRASDLAVNVVSWRALLSACKSYGDADLGRRCFDHLVSLQPTVATAYVLLGSIYANAGRWDEVERVEILRKAAGARRKAAKACIEVNKEVHEFTVGEERSDVAGTLRKMNKRVKEGGHVPQTQLVLRSVSEQEKEDALCGHAEKLALAYGLCNTPAGSTLVVTKNLRMCNDCHSSTKIMSRVEKREIVVRACHKVHRFQNGVCSCQDRP